MMRVLVTGGCGFIGQRLIRRLLGDGHTIRIIDNLSTGTLAAIQSFTAIERIEGPSPPPGAAVQVMVADIREAETAADACRDMEVVIHLAGQSGVAPSVADPIFDMTQNVLGTFNCLEGCRRHGINHFVFASSSAVVGQVEPPIHERLPANPMSPYGASKLAAEGYCSAYFHSFGIQTVALRFGNVYGPGSAHKESVVARFIRRALDGLPLEIYGDGGQTRDFVYIDDLVSAVIAAATTPGIGGEVFQIATARETTVGAIADALVAALTAQGLAGIRIEHMAPRLGDVRYNYSDTSKAASLMGWQATTPIEAGIAATVRWFLAERPRNG
jgi:UDP-glucose 4-epimerase